VVVPPAVIAPSRKRWLLMFSVDATSEPAFTCEPRLKKMPFWLIRMIWPPGVPFGPTELSLP
jgi:hypothetical protein